MAEPFRIALAGVGTVGGGVAHQLLTRGDELAHRAGRPLKLIAFSTREVDKPRRTDLAGIPWQANCVDLASTDAHIIVELIGGEDGPALDLIEAALEARKPVVTANKALLAAHGLRLATTAESAGIPLRFEAAAAGGIPIVKALRESLITYPIECVRGILNGTCNYILTEMEATGSPFAEVLRDAQAHGYAEADPALDVGGGDTAHKLAILSALAFGVAPGTRSMRVSGITAIEQEDISFAREFGYRIKLLGVARRNGQQLDQRVGPAMVKIATPLADVDGVFNAVVVHVASAGPFIFEGRGAGEEPTTSAVIADIVDIARGANGPAFGRPARDLEPVVSAPGDACRSPFYVRFALLDAPGALAEIAGHLAHAGVSIDSMIQRPQSTGDAVVIVMITHECSQTAIEAAIKAISASDKVVGIPCLIPMETI